MKRSEKLTWIIAMANPMDVSAPGAVTTLPGSGPPGDGVNRQIRENNGAAAASVAIEADVIGEEFQVIARGIRAQMLNALMQTTPQRLLSIPCIGNVYTSDLRNLLVGLKFTVTNQVFTPGRAGENLVGGGRSGVPVTINSQALKDYAALTGGLSYLIVHELAHALPALRAFNQAQFAAFAAQNPNLTIEQQYAAYDGTPGFIENEKRANSVGQAIAQNLNNFVTLAAPTNGFSTQC